jgi:hypothetical protein
MCSRHLLCWASDAEGMEGATKIADEVMVHLRRNQPQEEYSFYQNFSRTAPIKERYKGTERLQKLKDLKKRWDPKGIFANQLL